MELSVHLSGRNLAELEEIGRFWLPEGKSRTIDDEEILSEELTRAMLTQEVVVCRDRRRIMENHCPQHRE